MRGIVAKSLLCACLGFAFTPSAFSVELPAAIKSSGVLRVAVEPVYPPLEFRDPATNELIGFDIDLGKALAECD